MIGRDPMEARRRMEESRETLAKLLGARPSEVIFTAGGTESDNLAVKGIYWARRDAEPRRRRIVTTASGAAVAICSASSYADRSASSGSTSRSHKPISNASVPPNRRPVSNNSAARCSPTTRGSDTDMPKPWLTLCACGCRPPPWAASSP